jgi:hypothetical protein
MRTVYIAPRGLVAEALASPTPQRWLGSEPGASDVPRQIAD